MKKLLYTLIVVLITWMATMIYFIHTINGRAENSDVPTTEIANEAPINIETARINAIEAVSEAIVGVVNQFQGGTRGQGSGVIYKVEDGNTFVVTNEHVISGGDTFTIVFFNNKQIQAELVGSDIYTDLAVLKIKDFEAEVVARFGNSEDLQIGQDVIAIGNPLGLAFAGSATAGIISGQGRSVPVTLNNLHNEEWEMNVLQTDAAINPGNSGGALINLNGEVIGINSMKIAEAKVEGMSFSIPTYIAVPIIEELTAHGEVVRPLLGITLINVSDISSNFKEAMGIPLDQQQGALVNQVQEGSLAESMGIESSDIIVAINNVGVDDASQLRQRLFSYRDGDQIIVTVLRGEEEIDVKAVISIPR